MGIFAFNSKANEQVHSWNLKLEEILAKSLPKDREMIDRLNARKGFALSGLFPVFFGEMFGLETRGEVANVNAAFNLSCGYVDRYIDGQLGLETSPDLADVRGLAKEIIGGFYGLFHGKDPSNEYLRSVKPLVSYVMSNFLASSHADLMKVIKGYKEAAEKELDAKTIEEKEKARIEIGRTYATVASFMIDSFSEGKLEESHRRAIEDYMIGSTIADDFADIFIDMRTPTGSHLNDRAKQGGNLPFILLSQFAESVRYFQKGKSELKDTKQRREYGSLVAIGLLFYSKSFVIKAAEHFIHFYLPNMLNPVRKIGSYATH